jgi:hypothetical protein
VASDPFAKTPERPVRDAIAIAFLAGVLRKADRLALDGEGTWT